jgi:hypothetical protein
MPRTANGPERSVITPSVTDESVMPGPSLMPSTVPLSESLDLVAQPLTTTDARTDAAMRVRELDMVFS